MESLLPPKTDVLSENRSHSRIRRLSEHIRKETVSSSSNPVIGQGDATVGKNLTHSYQDLRKERGRSDTYEPSCFEGNNQTVVCFVGTDRLIKIKLTKHGLFTV